MTFHIEQVATGKFYGTAGAWTWERANALEFVIIAVAHEMCRALRLEELRLEEIQIVEEESDGRRVIHSVKD